MQMYVAGEWRGSPLEDEVRSPYSGEVVDTVPRATDEDVEQALGAALVGAHTMRRLSAYDRAAIVNRAADLLAEAADEFARTISAEEGKPLSEALGEARRTPDLLRVAASEGARMHGETIPVDAAPGNADKIAFTIRQPCGVVVAITPFNYPLLLVAHKVAPALAAGNAVILKPASQTPLVALKLTRLFLEAGLPEHALQCLTGPGSTVGPALCADARVRKISFTGSKDVGEGVTAVAGVKRLSLELGSSCPLIVLPDADLEQVASATATGGYVNAGQACISVQRVLVGREVYGDFLDALRPKVESIKVGDPFEDGTGVSALISEREAERVEDVIRRAVDDGAALVTGGEREGGVVQPAIVADVSPEMAISRDELFGPAVAVSAVDGIDEAIELANATEYGLGAGIFTSDVTNALRFARDVDCGNVQINNTPLWRADLMPYGGLKGSGIGKEGPRYAIEEMTELKSVVFHGIGGRE
ncbi:MAG: aldehyde dehydrogenase family protein [Actinomycetota bacterium]|jgi:acyl-CoA reductase-like NAD-dependent aldehyde dehydrogenase|nr:aldehyde dehydrogenase family protein [Actinomycetota bacterium]